ncbi:MAG: hypothetical protein J5933_05265 [Clostridia bacterium]|nr:hypothetical protein [Clostridia bacterium]
MKTIKSVISVFLSLAMIFLFAACSGNVTPDDPGTGTDSDTDTVQNDTTASGIEYEKDKLPENLDFGGAKVVILSPAHGLMASDVTVDELSSEIVSDSIYNRKLSVEERLNVEIVNVKTTTLDEDMQKLIGADEDMYQIVVGETYGYSKYSFDGVLYDLNTVEYLDLDSPWWSSLFIKEASIGDSLYIATGSISLSLIRNFIVCFFNKALAENYRHNSELSDLEDLYTIVENGNWTLDKLHTLSASVYSDENGNSMKDEEDIFGLGLHGYSLDVIWSAFDLNVLSPTEDGWFELDVNTDRLFNAMEKITDLLHNSSGVYLPETLPSSTDAMFSSGRFLFAVDYLSISEKGTLRNMADEYGVLPFPKLDDSQSSYFSYAYDDYLSYSIPLTNGSPEIAGAVMEAMASYSYRETVPAYLDVALKGKYMNDPQSRKMIDLIVENFKLDTAWIYIFTIGGGYPSGYRNNIYENKRTFASEHQSNAQSVKRNLIGFKLKYDQNVGN